MADRSSRSPLCLRSVVLAALSLSASGCWCGNVPDEIYDESVSGVIGGADLEMIRSDNPTDTERCEAACRFINDNMPEGETGGPINIESVVSCTATGMEGGPADPWDPAQTEVTIDCVGRHTEPGFCTGRRPQGHRELPMRDHGRGEWLRIHAHLERASITAFEQLATTLGKWDAPAELRARCRQAAADEVVHAELLEALLLAEGGAPAAVEIAVDPGAGEDRLAVAIHNAVEGCVSEAFAATIAAHQAEHAEDPTLRSIFARIAEDELRHGQLAWDLHGYFMARLTPAQQEQVRAAQAQALRALADTAGDNAAATAPGLGWPSVEVAAAMARIFAAAVDRQLGAQPDRALHLGLLAA